VREFDPIPEWVARGFPTKPAKLEAAIARYFRDRDLDAARYEELRIRGAEALSQYDRMMQGDDGALRTALSLKFNHISYQMMHLQFARTTWPTLYQFIQDSPAPPPQPPEAEPEEDPEDFGLATDPGEVLEDLGIADDSQLSLF
jgi:hypothetical protein